MKGRPRVHFSFRSPFSWMAIERLLDEIPDAFAALEFIPFWDPDPCTAEMLAERDAEFHYVQMSKAKHLYILQDTKRQAQRLGLSMRWPVDRDPWWEVPHLAWLRARRLGAAQEFYRAVCDARWGHGRDVCTLEAVAELAASIGLDGALLAGATKDPSIRDEAADCLVAAYFDDIFGIPYFRLGRHRFWGLDRLEGFVAEYRAAASSSPAPDRVQFVEAQVPVGAYDTDTAGGCG
ncbi:DsbA family protein [Amycolatopsis sp. NPDC004079]|uniref:2-hydroxychromene-2-carboxylate isomerase n=1 Tax=Amycolatopsis sp. NPDC004079 TaxID=3154549 RepID=UPI0033BDEDE4